MPRVSQEELYNDKDVVTQILKLKDTVNDYAGGIIENIDISGNDLVIDWASGESISLPLPNPTGISSISGVVSGGNLTITIYMTDGSSHAFTCPLVGFVTLDTAQTIASKKIFSVSPDVPTAPEGYDSAVNMDYVNDSSGVNNIVHLDGNEDIHGRKTVKGMVKTPIMEPLFILHQPAGNYVHMYDMAENGRTIMGFRGDGVGYLGFGEIKYISPSNHTSEIVIFDYNALISAAMFNGFDIFQLKNVVTNKVEVWGHPNGLRVHLYPVVIIKNGVDVNIEAITVVNTSQSTDPSLDTTTYPAGKQSITKKLLQ